MRIISGIWNGLHRTFLRQFLTIFILTMAMVVYPHFINYMMFDASVQRAEIKPSFVEYVDSQINFKSPKTFIVSNAVSLVRFHCNNIFFFGKSFIVWLMDRQTPYETFIVYQCFIYYFLMIYSLVFSISVLIRYHCDWHIYPNTAYWMDKWYIRWTVNFLIFMLIVNTISFIIACVIMWKSRDEH